MRNNKLPIWYRNFHQANLNSNNLLISITDFSVHLSPTNKGFIKNYTIRLDGLIDLQKGVVVLSNDEFRTGRNQKLPGGLDVPGFGMYNATPDILTFRSSEIWDNFNFQLNYVIASNLNTDGMIIHEIALRIDEVIQHDGFTFIRFQLVFTAVLSADADTLYDFNADTLQNDLLACLMQEMPSPQLIPIIASLGGKLNEDVANVAPIIYIAIGAVEVNGQRIINEEAALAIISLGADIECSPSKNKDRCPLIFAVQNGLNSVVKVLLEKGANPNHIDSRDVTPLFLAAMKNNLELCQVLVAAGADLNLKSYNGQLPIDSARNNNHQEIVEFFESL